MKTVSRLSLFTLVCLSLALMLFGSTADVHAQKASLEVTGDTGTDKFYPVGQTVETGFVAKLAGAVQPEVKLTITYNGLTGVTVTDGGTTNINGLVVVKGKIANPTAYIKAVWADKQLQAQADFNRGDDPAPVVIIVNPPKSFKPNAGVRSIGSTFTQEITIKNKDATRSTLPLSAWQMDVVFNPLILGVVKVTEGDFLKSGGKVTYYTQNILPGSISVSQSLPGHTDKAPLTPDKDEDVAKLPKVAGTSLMPGKEGKLLTIEFKVLAVAEEALGIHNVRLQSSRDYDELPDLDGDGKPDGVPDRISYAILIKDVFVATHQSSESVDVNQDGKVNIQDLVMVAGSIGAIPHNPRADVNGDGFVNVLDLITVYESEHWAKSVPPDEVADANKPPAVAAPSISGHLDPATIQSWIDLAQIEDDGSAIFDLGIANLETLLAPRIPSKTRLLLNYPNPFNPETWIPYQLAEATDVTVTIHSMNGSLIRTLALGHQAAGVYQSKSQAAYWDGRNELGEHVASGLYFYTLTAGNFSATGKMLVRK